MSYPNFYKETCEAIIDSHHTIDDIDFFSMIIGKDCMDNTKEIQFSFDDFKRNANFNYDNGYGSAKINTSLKIIFKDGSFLERREYDGSEWWEFVQIPKKDKSKFYTGKLINFSNTY